ncbi:MAG TPA: CHAD domain-containing protein [Burkholderiales bacterium]|nr:CHAD domain-containing protein [Burkholderiales bacterium]
MHIETRLTLLIATECVARLRRHPLLKSQLRSHTIKFTSIYYDTPDLSLKSKNTVLQLRKEGVRYRLSIRTECMESAGLHRCRKWEMFQMRNVPDFSGLEQAVPNSMLAVSDFRFRLHSLFTARLVSKTIALDFGGNRIDYCFDQGELRSGDQFEEICEIGLELQSGNSAALFEFALELQKTIPLKLEQKSLAERGYDLFSGKTVAVATPAVAIALHKKAGVSAACKEIVRGCLRQMQANVPGVAAGNADSEYLHQLRVASRRMRSSFNVFSDFFGKAVFSGFSSELEWLSGELGPARNWDIFMLETFPQVLKALPAERSLPALRQAAESKRRVGLSRAVAAVTSQRYQTLLLKLGAALNDAAWPAPDAASPVSISDFAKRILDQRYRNFRRRGKNFKTLPADKLHALRIAGKKLRYAAEFFAPIYRGRDARTYLEAMSILQDALGAVNDAVTTGLLLNEFSVADAEASSLIKGWIACRTGQHVAGLASQWKRFKSAPVFWK